MRLLLTGGGGFVGQRLLTSLTSQYEVVSLGRSSHGENIERCTYVQADLTDARALAIIAESLGEFDAVIHMAAYVPYESASDELQAAHDVNIQGTINLLSTFGDRAGRLIIGSTAEVYDQGKITGLLTADTVTGPTSYYGATKLSSELIACAYGKKESLPVTVLRFSVMYGPNDPISRALPNFIKKALKNEEIHVTGGDVKRDYIYIDDVVSSIHCALESSTQGVINIGTGYAVSIKDAAHTVVDIAKSESIVSVSDAVSGVDIVVDATEAENAIGFKAKKNFPQGIEEMIASFR